MERAQVHYELFFRGAAPGWKLELATEDRTRAMETAEAMIADGRASAIRVTKETLDEETREFKTVTILTKGDATEVKAKKVAETYDPLCVSPQDLYTSHARERIGRLLDDWLLRHRATPFELLHRPDLIEKLEAAGMDLQHAIQKISIPEAQDRNVGTHEVIRHYQGLCDAACQRVGKDHRRGAFPEVTTQTFARVCEKLLPEPEKAYLLGAGVAMSIAAAQTWNDKVARLLDLADAAPTSPPARALAFQVLETILAEILGSRGGLGELLGADLDLGGNLAAMTRLAACETVDLLISREAGVAKIMPELKGPAARLANWLDGSQFEVVRAALAQRVLRELTSPRRLRPTDPEGEIDVLRALAMCLTAAAGKLLPLDQVQEAFVDRSRMLVRSDFVEVYLGEDRTPLGEVEALTWLAENITGAANKRAASRWIGANVSALRFERDVRASPDSPATKLAALAGLQRSVSRVGFIAEEVTPLLATLGDVGGMVEADSKLVQMVAKANAPASHRLTLLLRLAAGETAPLGPAADRARAEVMRMVKAPEIRAEIAKSPDILEKVRGLMAA